MAYIIKKLIVESSKDINEELKKNEIFTNTVINIETAGSKLIVWYKYEK